VTAAVACSGEAFEVIGDPLAAPLITIVTRSVDGRAVPVSDLGEIPLVHPPQGGKVVFAGVRARNVTSVLQITASLRDEESGRIVGHEGRPVMLARAPDGWGEPAQPAELSNYANIPACPSGNIAIQRDMYGRSYTLKVRVEDRRGRTAEASVRVVPACAEPAFLEQCRCECAAGYVLGASCVPDGGVVDGGP
jgi:hypothetical protein